MVNPSHLGREEEERWSTGLAAFRDGIRVRRSTVQVRPLAVCFWALASTPSIRELWSAKTRLWRNL